MDHIDKKGKVKTAIFYADKEDEIQNILIGRSIEVLRFTAFSSLGSGFREWILLRAEAHGGNCQGRHCKKDN